MNLLCETLFCLHLVFVPPLPGEGPPMSAAFGVTRGDGAPIEDFLSERDLKVCQDDAIKFGDGRTFMKARGNAFFRVKDAKCVPNSMVPSWRHRGSQDDD